MNDVATYPVETVELDRRQGKTYRIISDVLCHLAQNERATAAIVSAGPDGSRALRDEINRVFHPALAARVVMRPAQSAHMLRGGNCRVWVDDIDLFPAGIDLSWLWMMDVAFVTSTPPYCHLGRLDEHAEEAGHRLLREKNQ